MGRNDQASLELPSIPIGHVHPVLQGVVQIVVVQRHIGNAQTIQFPHHLIGQHPVPYALKEGSSLMESPLGVAKHLGRRRGVLSSAIESAVAGVDKDDGVGKHGLILGFQRSKVPGFQGSELNPGTLERWNPVYF